MIAIANPVTWYFPINNTMIKIRHILDINVDFYESNDKLNNDIQVIIGVSI